MALDEAKGREDLAEHLYTTEMSVEDVRATLAKAPKAEAAKEDSEFYDRARITGAGLRESHVHDVMITREAPNYPSAV
jgi:hypothetical protein